MSHVDSELSEKGSWSQENVVEENPVDTQCGFTDSCKPKWLQKFANPKTFLVVLFSCTIVEGFGVNGINSVNISAYERRYNLSSSSSSLVISFYDISAGLLVMFIGYFGAKAHQPRLLSMACLSLGLGTLVMAMAQFTSPPYNPGSTGQSTVCGNNTSAEEDESETYLQNYIYFLIFGQILNGFGGSCLFTIGMNVLDQSTSPKVAALYLGIFSSGAALGPALGFTVGGSFLNIYVDYPNSPPEGLTVEDPAWVGAWWLPLILTSVLCFILSFFMFLFPREFPGTAAIQAAKVSEAHDDGTESEISSAEGFGIGWRDLPKSTLYLLKNPCYMLLVISAALDTLILMGFVAFLPKIIANQFSQSLQWASLLTGILAVPPAALAQFLEGYIIKRFELNLGQILKLIVATSFIALLLSPVYLARCNDTPIAGVAINYPGQNVTGNKELSLDSTCNSGCGCTTSVYDPVCADGIQYFSPCHAGCSLEPVKNDNGIKVYQNCSCTVQTDLVSNKTGYPIEAENTICEVDCMLLYTVFTPFVFLLGFFSTLAATPSSVAIFRVLPGQIKAYGLAVSWVFLRFLGSVPGPIIFGTMLDSTCKVWQNDNGEGSTGSCWMYNSNEMAYKLVILIAIFKIPSLICASIATKLYKPPPTVRDRNPNQMSLAEK